jgi:hypothetical protein
VQVASGGCVVITSLVFYLASNRIKTLHTLTFHVIGTTPPSELYTPLLEFIAGPGQRPAKAIREILRRLDGDGRTSDNRSVKGYAAISGYEPPDELAGAAAERSSSWSLLTSLAHLKLKISEKFSAAMSA